MDNNNYTRKLDAQLATDNAILVKLRSNFYQYQVDKKADEISRGKVLAKKRCKIFAALDKEKKATGIILDKINKSLKVPGNSLKKLDRRD